jgi:mannosyltransferase OCH1-like enzyme
MIPKIIHQMWIGPKPPPIKLMDTWKEKNPSYEYIFWNEEEIKKRNMHFTCQDDIETMSEINGKADIMRWEILYKYGGIFIDADSICLEPLTPLFHTCKGFASWENEIIRPGLLSTCCMGFTPRHEICGAAIDWIENNDVCVERTKQPAWVLTGPNLLTEIYKKKKFENFSVYPSYFFSPIHYSGKLYLGHSKVYGLHVWGSTKQAYETMHTIKLPKFFEKPEEAISLLVYNENTKCLHVSEFLKSVTNQLGHFEIELIWLDNATDTFTTYAFKKELEHWLQYTRFVTLVYKKMDPGTNMTNCLNQGLQLCSHDYVFQMDVNKNK